MKLTVGGGGGVSHPGPDHKQMWKFWSFFSLILWHSKQISLWKVSLGLCASTELSCMSGVESVHISFGRGWINGRQHCKIQCHYCDEVPCLMNGNIVLNKWMKRAPKMKIRRKWHKQMQLIVNQFWLWIATPTTHRGSPCGHSCPCCLVELSDIARKNWCVTTNNPKLWTSQMSQSKTYGYQCQMILLRGHTKIYITFGCPGRPPPSFPYVIL